MCNFGKMARKFVGSCLIIVCFVGVASYSTTTQAVPTTSYSVWKQNNTVPVSGPPDVDINDTESTTYWPGPYDYDRNDTDWWPELYDQDDNNTNWTAYMEFTDTPPSKHSSPYGYGSKDCEGRAWCDPYIRGFSYPDLNCFCDALCHVMNDCCENIKDVVDVDVNLASFPDKSQFICSETLAGVWPDDSQYGMLIAAKCPSSWTDNDTRGLCETYVDVKDKGDIYLQTPVSSNTSGVEVMYKNMYCAYCNYEYDFLYWDHVYECKSRPANGTKLSREDCNISSFNPPAPGYEIRKCPVEPYISSCNTSTDQELEEKCINGPYFYLFERDGMRYFRNVYCAECNGYKNDSVYCQSHLTFYDRGYFPRRSFRLLVDLNAGRQSGSEIEQMSQCSDNQVYDMIEQVCREIFCVPPAVARNGRCAYVTSAGLFLDYPPSNNNTANCTWVKLEPKEYKMDNESSLIILATERVYSVSEYILNNTDVLVCADDDAICRDDCRRKKGDLNFSETEGYVSSIGMIISIIALFITFIVYVSLPQLLNTPGKILVCLVLALLLAQLLFLTSPEFLLSPKWCRAVAVLIHYFFLAAFCWMNVISFDLWMTFSNSFGATGSSKSSRRLLKYILYAWGLPFVVVCIAVALDLLFNLGSEYSHLQPGYGNGVCWISSSDALLLFFVGPLAVFKLFDIVSFIITAVHIAKAKRQGAMARQKKNTCSLIINLKLSLIMGLTWVFAFLGNLTNSTAMWYLFIVFNTLQGLFIAICFLCTKKVWRLVRAKYSEVTSTSLTSRTSATQLSYMSKSVSANKPTSDSKI